MGIQEEPAAVWATSLFLNLQGKLVSVGLHGGDLSETHCRTSDNPFTISEPKSNESISFESG